MSIDEFLGRLEKVEKTGENSWRALCPAHGDRNPSLDVTLKGDKILIICRAGCDTKSVVEAMGLKMSDLFLRDRPKVEKRDYGRLEAEYRYEDEDGTLLYCVERKRLQDGRKTFLQYIPAAGTKYGKEYGLHEKGSGRLKVKYMVPYRLPRVLAARDGGMPLFIMEGEKDVGNYERLAEGKTRIPATCNTAGAGHWGNDWPSDWGKWFRGIGKICIIADNDPESKGGKGHLKGQKHAWDVQRKLREAGYEGEIKLMVMPAVGAEHPKDFSDWVEALKANGEEATLEMFLGAVASAEKWPAAWEFKKEELGVGTEKARRAAEEVEEHLGGRFGKRIERASPLCDQYGIAFDTGGSERIPCIFDVGLDPGEIFATIYATILKRMPEGKGLDSKTIVKVKAWSGVLWLLTRGRFFWNIDVPKFDTCMYLDRDAKRGNRLMAISSDEFYAFLARNARLDDVDPKKGDLAKMLGVVKQAAMDEGYSTGTKPGIAWQNAHGNIYISSGDTRMCRVSAGRVEMVENGTDGVVFLTGETLVPWELESGGGIDPFGTAQLFKGAAYATPTGNMMLRL